MTRKVPAAVALLGAALAAAGLALTASAGSAQAQPEPDTKVRPGYWRYETKVSIFGGSSETKCLKREEIERFLFNPCNRHHVCTYPVKQVGNGRLHLEGQWVKKKNGGKPIPVTADGTYTPTTLNMNAKVKVLGMSVTGQIHGTWVSDTCPAGEKQGSK